MKKDEIWVHPVTEMKLEDIIRREISQSGKTNPVWFHLYGIFIIEKKDIKTKSRMVNPSD